MNMTHQQAVARLHEISDRLEELRDADALTRADEQEFRALSDEWSRVDAHRQEIERRAEAASAARGGRFRTEGEGDGLGAFADDLDTDRGTGLRGQAMRALDTATAANRLPTRAAELVEGLLSVGPEVERNWLARYVVESGSAAYRSAFAKILVHGEARAGLEFTAAEREAFQRVSTLKSEQRAMSLSDTAGGYLVPFEVDPAVILTSAGSINPILQIARVIPTISDVWHGVSSSGVTAEWLGEANEASDGSPTLAEPAIPAYKQSIFVPYSVELEGDASALIQQLSFLMVDAASNHLNAALTTGSGTGQPTGIVTALTGTGSQVNTATPDTLAPGDIFAVQAALPPRFSANAQWAASLPILNTLRQFETVNGAVKFPELAANPPQLLGRNVNELSNMDASIDAGQANAIVVYGDWRHYVVTQRVGGSVELVNHLFGANRRPTGQRGLWYWARWGADSVADNAFRLLVA